MNTIYHRVTQSLTEGKIIGIKTLWDSVLLRGEKSYDFTFAPTDMLDAL